MASVYPSAVKLAAIRRYPERKVADAPPLDR
jgi:hypothetical protein